MGLWSLSSFDLPESQEVIEVLSHRRNIVPNPVGTRDIEQADCLEDRPVLSVGAQSSCSLTHSRADLAKDAPH